MVRLTLLLLALSTALISCKETPEEKLLSQIEEEFQKQEGTFAVAFRDMSSGKEFFLNERMLFHAASTMKTPVMVEVFKQAEEGKFSFLDSIVIKNEFKSIVDSSTYSLNAKDDSDTLIYQHIGEKRSVYSLMYDMIIISSNLATNLIIEKVNATHVTQSLRDIGANDIQVLRGVEDSKAYEAGLNNQVTAYDLMLLFEKIANGTMVNKEASQQMISILLDQKFNDIIPGKLPPEVKVAHKTGSISGVRHDSGIVMLPDGRNYVLVLLSKELKDIEAGKKSMAAVSEMIYNYVTATNATP